MAIYQREPEANIALMALLYNAYHQNRFATKPSESRKSVPTVTETVQSSPHRASRTSAAFTSASSAASETIPSERRLTA